MSEEAKKDAAPAAAAAPAKKGGGIGLILGIVLPALLSAGGAFGGVKAASHGAAHGGGGGHEAEPAPRHEPRPPGPTVNLEPFLVSIADTQKKGHPMKLTVAIEFESTAKEETLKTYTPRIRDAILAYMRTLTYEEATDQEHAHKLREELLEKVQKSGAVAAERVLITDLVSQ